MCQHLLWEGALLVIPSPGSVNEAAVSVAKHVYNAPKCPQENNEKEGIVRVYPQWFYNSSITKCTLAFRAEACSLSSAKFLLHVRINGCISMTPFCPSACWDLFSGLRSFAAVKFHVLFTVCFMASSDFIRKTYALTLQAYNESYPT